MKPGSNPVAKEGFTLPDFLLPPIDVLIIWHSYLLNPLRAWEDSIRIKGKEHLLGARFPLDSMVSWRLTTRTLLAAELMALFLLQAASLNSNLRPTTPAAARFWESNIPSSSFHLPLQAPPFVPKGAAGRDGLRYTCPSKSCRRSIFVSWTSMDFPGPIPASGYDRGLSDQHWKRVCEGCSLTLDADVLRGVRLAVSNLTFTSPLLQLLSSLPSLSDIRMI